VFVRGQTKAAYEGHLRTSEPANENEARARTIAAKLLLLLPMISSDELIWLVLSGLFKEK
jgi:hypothetical protein